MPCRMIRRVQAYARLIALFAFWRRRGCSSREAWEKAQATL